MLSSSASTTACNLLAPFAALLYQLCVAGSNLVDALIEAACGSDPAVQCIQEKVELVNNILTAVCNGVLTSSASDGVSSTSAAHPCVDMTVRAINTVLQIVCRSSDPATCASNLLTTINNLLNSLCGSTLLSSSDMSGASVVAIEYAASTTVVDHPCAEKLLETIELVMQIACGSTDPATCAENLLSLLGAAGGTWKSPLCEVDGTPWLNAGFCTPPGDQSDSAPVQDSCEGSIHCEMTYSELESLGYGTSELRAGQSQALPDLNSQMASTAGDRYGAWVNYFNYSQTLSPDRCLNTVVDNGHCGWVYHQYRLNRGGSPGPVTFVTDFPARSGNNSPPDMWTPNVGPAPDRFRSAPGSSIQSYFAWGRMNGSFTGFEPDQGTSFYPGKWRLDPWTIYRPAASQISRGAFEIHGGTGPSELFSSRTQGCIRLSVQGIRGLRAKWHNRTDNKRSAKVYPKHY